MVDLPLGTGARFLRPSIYSDCWGRTARHRIFGLLDSFARFAVQGVGTPAPIFPPRRLVVTGLYRYVRNPMYVAVVSTILGQGLIFGNFTLLAYGALIWLLFHVFVLVYEEPTLRAGFGSEYGLFCAAVPRWIPRLTAWDSRRDGSSALPNNP